MAYKRAMMFWFTVVRMMFFRTVTLFVVKVGFENLPWASMLVSPSFGIGAGFGGPRTPLPFEPDGTEFGIPSNRTGGRSGASDGAPVPGAAGGSTGWSAIVIRIQVCRTLVNDNKNLKAQKNVSRCD